MRPALLLMLALAAPGQDWTPLFDGKTLKGWTPRATTAPGTGDWAVRDGAIYCGGKEPGWLSTDAAFRDFRLQLEFKGPADVNSGVFLRSQTQGQPHVTGYELQIWDMQPQGYLTGSLVGSLKAGPTRIKANEWNHYDITARGDHFMVKLNGQTVLDARDAKHREGQIGFQCQPKQTIWFRDIRVQRLERSGLTAGEVVGRIQKAVAVPWQEKTVDTLKSGTVETPVTGIVTTFMATLEVLQKAVAEGKNMIITHEPTFYLHDDSTEATANDPTVIAKKALIEKHNLVIFRFHDHWHRRQPDGIRVGMMKALGWENGMPQGLTLRELAEALKKRLGIAAVRMIGDPGMKAGRIALTPGYASLNGSMRELAKSDVLIIGEAREWEVYEYVQDQIASGQKKGLIVLGHASSEEGGMKEAAEWLRGLVPELPVAHIAAGQLFTVQ